MTDQTRLAVEACLDPTIGLDDNSNRMDDRALRGVIYERIVSPLEDELEQGFNGLAVDRLDTLVRNLDLANGGQPLPPDDKVQNSKLTRNSNGTKRRGSDDAGRPRLRVRFSQDLEIGHPRQDGPQQAAGDKLCASDHTIDK